MACKPSMIYHVLFVRLVMHTFSLTHRGYYSIIIAHVNLFSYKSHFFPLKYTLPPLLYNDSSITDDTYNLNGY